MSANIPTTGTPRQLDRPAQPEEQITEEHATDASRLSRLLMTVLRDIASLKRRWWPERLDFVDRVVDATGTTKYRLPHGLRGRVRWWVVDWQGSAGPGLARHADTDANTLVLVSYVAGTATVRVEEAGA
jgi:hypothetical protein